MIPQDIQEKHRKRVSLRQSGKFDEADRLREELAKQGYMISDKPDGISEIIIKTNTAGRITTRQPVIAVFGSGEMSSIGRGIHETLIKNLPKPIHIALLETPAGFQDNPHHWYIRLKQKLESGLQNYAPDISLVSALHQEGPNNTNDPQILEPLLRADYIHTGAGSPSYATRHLKNSLALKYIMSRINAGIPLSIASAAAIAFGKYALPVYEMYFAGHDPYWMAGLNFFEQWGLNVSFIPHWNNKEGGSDTDTRYAYMGQKRFNKLLELLPGPTNIIGIDEHTAIIFHPEEQAVSVLGKGNVTVLQGDKTTSYSKGKKIKFTDLEPHQLKAG